MKCFAIVALLFFVAFSLAQESYIVVFDKDITNERIAAHMFDVVPFVFANYSIGMEFRGYAARLTKKQMTQVMATGDVAYFELDQMMHATQACNVQSNAVWGINRISERNLQLSGDYRYDSDGSGVQAFIVDTGIRITHNEFTGRATWGANYVGDGQNTDCNGHGTHVAGTVGGTTYGVAKKVSLIAVKVLGCTGSGTNSGVISGVQYCATNKKNKPSVANMSLGGGYSKALNDAVAAAVKAGVSFAVAAGNENQDACNTSPASEPSALTVGSTDVDDESSVEKDIRSSFSNFGTCVKIMAPGSLIKSAWYTSNTATNTISGTSMASPHVCGAAASYLSENPTATPAQVTSFLTSQSTPSVIDLSCGTNAACNRTPNKLLFSGCG